MAGTSERGGRAVCSCLNHQGSLIHDQQVSRGALVSDRSRHAHMQRHSLFPEILHAQTRCQYILALLIQNQNLPDKGTALPFLKRQEIAMVRGAILVARRRLRPSSSIR